VPSGRGRVVFMLADVDTARLLRALSLAGPTPAMTLASRLELCDQRVRAILGGALQAGIVRQATGVDGCYEVDATALSAMMRRHRDELLGSAA